MNDANAPEVTDPNLPPLQRLMLSRQRIRQSLVEAAEPPAPPAGEPSVLVTALMAIPGVGVVVDSVRGWWAQHPLHFAGTLAGNTVRGMMRPMARRSPYRLVFAAVAVGGLLYWVKPWRGLLKPALLAGLLPHLVSRAVANVPMESWMSTLMTMGASKQDPDITPEGAAAVAEAAAQAANDAAAASSAQAPQASSPTAQASAPVVSVTARPDGAASAATATGTTSTGTHATGHGNLPPQRPSVLH